MQGGDILLVTGDGKLSKSLVDGQKLIYRGAISSHAELGTGDGIFVQATMKKGVHLTFIVDELKKCAERWKVIRLKGIDKTEQKKIVESGYFYLRQSYNKLFMGSGTDDSSFCSELVAKAYEKAEVTILNGTIPSKVAPAHFDREAKDGSQWLDVTDEYVDELEKMEENLDYYRELLEKIRLSMKNKAVQKDLNKITHDLASTIIKDKDWLDEAYKRLTDGQIKGWDDKDN